MSARYIVCGKLDNRAELGPFSGNASAKVRLFVKGRVPDRQGLPLSAGEDHVWFEGKFWEVRAFLSMAAARGEKRLLVLTGREHLHIVEEAAAYGLQVQVFETAFPIFPTIRYSSCLRTNFDILTKCLRKLDQLSIHSGSLSRDLSERHLRISARKVGQKNGYDRHFFFAYKDAYQEVFKLKEERPERVIIALDFNSMYLDSMQGRFCNPASVEYADFRGQHPDPDSLAYGIYRVRLRSARPGFILDHHPFRYRRLGRSHYFQMQCRDTIETLLHKDEISYFIRHFEEVEVVEGLLSNDTIEHPLLKQGMALYAQRLYHRRRGDRIKENLSKISLQHMHSATNQKQFAKKYFKSLDKVKDFLTARFAMNLDSVGMDEIVDFLSRHKYFELALTPRGYQLFYLDTGASSNIFSLSAQVVANARIKMLQTLECLLDCPSVELCYSNVDSIHLSIPQKEVDAFLERHRSLISENVGALKIEAIADQGYWFDVGRYWLKKDGKVVLYKNRGFAHQAASDPFVCRRKLNRLIKTPAFTHLHTYITKIEHTFTYHKRLVHPTAQESRFVRFCYEDICGPDTANLTEAREQLHSKKEKVGLFQHISDYVREAGDEG